MLRCVACDKAMSDITKDACGFCESVIMSLIPKSLMKGTIQCNNEATPDSPDTLTPTYHLTLQSDSIGAHSVIKLCPLEDSLSGEQAVDGACTAINVVLLDDISEMV